MKTISLSIAQRLQLVAFLNTFQGKSYETLVQVWKLIDKVSITEEERNSIGLKIEGTQITWDMSKAEDLNVEFSLDEEKVFNDEFERVSKENKLDVSQYNLAQIYIKLKQPKEEVESSSPAGLN